MTNKVFTKTRKLHRSSTDSVIVGVAGGIGDYFNIDSTLIRLIFILITLFGGSGVLVYLTLWLVIPGVGNKSDNCEETIKVNTGEIKQKLHSPLNLGWIMVGFGVLFLLNNFGVFSFFRWDIWWPVLIIGLGLFLLARKDNHD